MRSLCMDHNPFFWASRIRIVLDVCACALVYFNLTGSYFKNLGFLALFLPKTPVTWLIMVWGQIQGHFLTFWTWFKGGSQSFIALSPISKKLEKLRKIFEISVFWLQLLFGHNSSKNCSNCIELAATYYKSGSTNQNMSLFSRSDFKVTPNC